jgi:hypothetical protein
MFYALKTDGAGAIVSTYCGAETPGAGWTPITAAQYQAIIPGSTWNGTAVVAPPAPPPPTLPQQMAAILNTGTCQVASASVPAISGAYAIDTASRATLAEIVAGINAGDGLPGGGTGFIYDDARGAHTFAASGTITAEAQVLSVGKGLRDYLYAANQVVQGRGTVVPAQPWPIP